MLQRTRHAKREDLGIRKRPPAIDVMDSIHDEIVSPANRKRLQRPDTKCEHLLRFCRCLDDRCVVRLALRHVKQNFGRILLPAGSILEPNALCGVGKANRIVELDGNLRAGVQAGALAIAFLDHAQSVERSSQSPKRQLATDCR